MSTTATENTELADFSHLKQQLFQTIKIHKKNYPPQLETPIEKKDWKEVLKQRIGNSKSDPELFSSLDTHFKESLQHSIDTYKKAHPRRAKTSREKNIQDIQKIIQQSKTPTDLIHTLQYYFLDDDYQRGALYRSSLQDELVKCIENYEPVLRAAIATFGHPFARKSAQDNASFIHQPDPKDEKRELFFTLDAFIEDAIEVYLEEKSSRLHPHRASNIKTIRTILENKTISKEERLAQIETYVHSNQFHHPLGSDLKHRLLEAVTLFRRLNDCCKPLSAHIEAALQAYLHEKSHAVSFNRTHHIEQIRKILQDTLALGKKEQVAELVKFFKSDHFQPKFRSTLRKKVLAAARYALSLPNNTYHLSQDDPEKIIRKVATRAYTTATPQSENLIMGLHGVTDGKEVFDTLGELAQRHGFDTVSFDQWGHGEDDDRFQPAFKTTPAALLRITAKAFLAQQSGNYKNICLVGHSLGGAVFATMHDYIEANPKVRHVSLLAPAISKTVVSLADVTRLSRPSMYSAARYRYFRHSKPIEPSSSDHTTKTASKVRIERRMGAKTFSIWSLLPFMPRAFKALERLITGEKPSKVWDIWVGSRDRYHIDKEAKTLDALNTEKKVNIMLLQNQSHCMLWDRDRNLVLKECVIDRFQNVLDEAPLPPLTPTRLIRPISSAALSPSPSSATLSMSSSRSSTQSM